MRWWVPLILLLLGIVLIGLIGFVFLGRFVVSGTQESITTTTQPFVSTTIPSPSGNSISIASWNLQAFGEKKASNASLLQSYADKLRNYDIVVVLEIRDSSGTAFPKLCRLMEGYTCLISSRAGKTSSKEQYGVLYRNVEVLNTQDWNSGDNLGNFNRPPYGVSFRAGNWSFQIITEHTDPQDVPSEMNYLEAIADTANGPLDKIVLGDLNADCDYYHMPPANFKDWMWAIPDNEDTTVAATNCAYDRIILNQGAAEHFMNYSIIRDVSKEESDHYLLEGMFVTRDVPF
jgi:deoxyribonuclease-1-like protein